jgi:hypothetical protein
MSFILAAILRMIRHERQPVDYELDACTRRVQAMHKWRAVNILFWEIGSSPAILECVGNCLFQGGRDAKAMRLGQKCRRYGQA